MEQFTDWADMPVRTDNLDYLQDFDNNQGADNGIDDLFNQTLVGLQDLDVPTGFAYDLQQQQLQKGHLNNPLNSHLISHSLSNSMSLHGKKHSRKISGTAIFGFENHTRELSTDLGIHKEDKSVSPGQLLRGSVQNQQQHQQQQQQQQQHISPQRPVDIKEEEEEENISSQNQKGNDYIVTNNNPKSFKFPPSPSPSKSNHNHPRSTPSSSFSAKYLQELGRMDSGIKPENYVDDIGPLLQEENDNQANDKKQASQFNNTSNIKYVPIPVQEPSNAIRKREEFEPEPQQQMNNLGNTFLPPPTPSTMSQGSPDHSSPEPRSYDGESSPNNLNSSPLNSGLFYNPQFFSDDNNGSLINDGLDYSSPFNNNNINSVSSSPIKNYYSSPLRHVPLNNEDTTIDANETIAQMTPMKPSHPAMTPLKKNMVLEWSPIVSPNAKASEDVKSAIRQSSPRRRIKKTSLLPPGELDKYWTGPDEEKYFTCHYKNCGKKFTRRYNVRSHIQTHLSDRPFQCVYCPKSFVRQHDLNRHVKGHLEARHCKCPCGKEFTRVDALKKHRLRNICAGGIPDTDDCDNENPSSSIRSTIPENNGNEMTLFEQLNKEVQTFN